MYIVKRDSHNPLLHPERSHSWEEVATCNGCPIYKGKELHMVYRAMSNPDRIEAPDLYISSVGHTILKDGIHATDRRVLIAPDSDFDLYGCEDPRITKMGDEYYIFYTGLTQYPLTRDGIKIAGAKTKDFKTIEKFPVTTFNSKAMALFPKKIKGKMTFILTTDTDAAHSRVAIAQCENEEEMKDPAFWNSWYADVDAHSLKGVVRNDNEHIEVGAVPVETEHGWLVVYSHIQNFFHGSKIFGIEALLLDLNDPKKIIGRTSGPFIVPEEIYEEYGLVSNISFPTGALIEGEFLDVYYGASDTTTCRSRIRLADLLTSMMPESHVPLVKRYEANPILREIEAHPWEALDVFNPGALYLNDRFHIIYRAMSKDNTSVMGYASSNDGFIIHERLPEPIYVPREDFEAKKSGPTGYSGCEDPRLTVIGENIYMLYTAYNGIEVPRVAVTSISTSDFLAKKWNWSRPELLTPAGVDDKDACLFPETFNGKYCIFHRVSHHVCADFVDSLDFSKEKVTKCFEVFGPRRGMWDGEKVGIGGPPIKTKKGWLLLYHGVSHQGVYSVGAALLDKDNPTNVIARSADPILTPVEQYELEGQIPNVVFPCGNVVKDDTIYIYYGGADSVIGVATLSLEEILKKF